MTESSFQGTRFISSLIPALLLLFGLITIAGAAYQRMPGAAGAVLSIGGAVLLGFGALTARAVARDHASLRRIRHHAVRDDAPLRHGQRIAIGGRLVCDAPLTAPISGRRCAAYFFRIGQLQPRSTDGSSTTRREPIAAGLQAVPFALVAGTRRFPIRSMPQVDEASRVAGSGDDHEAALRALFDRLMDQPLDSMVPVEELWMSLRDGHAGPVERAARRFEAAAAGSLATDRLSVHEECVPVDCEVTLVGRFEAAGHALVAEHGPWGRALHLYEGRIDDVENRLVREVRGFGITAAVLLVVGPAMLAVPFLSSG